MHESHLIPQSAVRRSYLLTALSIILLCGLFLAFHCFRAPAPSILPAEPVSAVTTRIKRELALPAPEIVSAEPETPVASPVPETPTETRFSTETAVQLRELSGPILRQRFAAQQRLEAFAAASGDFKDVIPAQAKRIQEPEVVLTLARLLRDPQWSPMFLDYIQHRHGLEYIRQWLQVIETSLGTDTGFSSARNANDLSALLLRAETAFQQRSDEMAAKFQLDAAVASDAREVGMLDTLQAFVEAYRYWTVTKKREE